MRCELAAVLAALASTLAVPSGALARSIPPKIIHFSAGSAIPDGDQAAQLVREALKEGTDYLSGGPVGFVVAGYTDRVGSDVANKRLSCARARAVRDLMLRQGVPPHHIILHDFGEERPVIETADGVPHFRNRRVEISYLPLPISSRGAIKCI